MHSAVLLLRGRVGTARFKCERIHSLCRGSLESLAEEGEGDLLCLPIAARSAAAGAAVLFPCKRHDED